MVTIPIKTIIISIFLLIIPGLNCLAAKQCVILLHGLGRTQHSMAYLAFKLQHSNYIVVNQSYPSTQKNIDELAQEYLPRMINMCLKNHASKIHFVTHSLGGIVLRTYLQKHQIPRLGRIVMLAPPNHGSQIADSLHHHWLFHVIMGPAGQELTTDRNSTPNRLNQLKDYQIGVIAGNFSLNPFAKLFFHEENDGIVAVSSTQMNNMTDFIVLPVSHTFIMSNSLVIKEIKHFLSAGRFSNSLLVQNQLYLQSKRYN